MAETDNTQGKSAEELEAAAKLGGDGNDTVTGAGNDTLNGGDAGSLTVKTEEVKAKTDTAKTEVKETAKLAAKATKKAKVSIRSASGAIYHNPVTGATFDNEASKPTALDDWLDYQIEMGVLVIVTDEE